MRSLFPALLILPTLSACSGDEPSRPAPDPDYGTERVGTVPDFYGQVPKNLVMISMDTFRKDHLDRYGDLGLTPFMSTLAEQGVALDDHVQCSNWTYAATSCTLAGRTNIEAGFMPKLAVEEKREAWPDDTPFLAGYLDELGFDYSILVSSNGWLSPEQNNTQGYDEAFHPTFGGALNLYTEAYDRLVAAQRQGLADRWFLHVHLTEPHAPYTPPAAYLDGLDDLPPPKWDLSVKTEHYDVARGDEYATLSDEDRDLLEDHLRARYAGEVRWTDQQVAEIWAHLEQVGLLDDTLVVVWTDHGEQFWEHGYHTHAYTMYGEETDAIAFFWAKNIVPDAIDLPTSAIDLTPTLIDIYGGEQPPEVTGIPLSQATTDRTRYAMSVARLGAVQAAWRDDLKLTYSWFGTVRAFDLAADPEEQVNLYDPEDPSPEIQALWDELQPMIEAADPLVSEYSPLWPTPLYNP